MPQPIIDTRWQVLDDPAAVAAQTARRVVQAAARAIADRGRFRIVLAGGETPQLAYRLLRRADTDWARWCVYFGDERCLPTDDPQRNSRMTAESWLDSVPIPAASLHPIAAESGPEAAARAYQPVIARALPFDLVLLGVGEDGHTASLFPGHRHQAGALVHAVHQAPKPPSERVSLSAGALSNNRELIILATGAGKRSVISAWRAGAALPVARVGGMQGVDVLLDRAANG